MFAHNIPTTLRVALLLVVAITVYLSIAVSSPNLAVVDSSPIIRPQNGNSDAAGDLYGLGIRLGTYLQILGMLLSCLRTHEGSRAWVQFLSSSVCVSVLLSWTLLVCRRDISPCEAWLILSLINVFGMAGWVAIEDLPSESACEMAGSPVIDDSPSESSCETPESPVNDDWMASVRGEGIGASVTIMSTVWQSVSFIWFFATLFRELPNLGTHNRVWFFTAVDLSGWFRILMLFYSSLGCLLLPVQMMVYLQFVHGTFRAWAQRAIEVEDDNVQGSCTWRGFIRKIEEVSENIQKSVVFQEFREWHCQFMHKLSKIVLTDDRQREFPTLMRRVLCVWVLLVLVMTIVGVEKIIIYNDLSPQNSLYRPGQAIPLVLGVITAIDGLATACAP